MSKLLVIVLMFCSFMLGYRLAEYRHSNLESTPTETFSAIQPLPPGPSAVGPTVTVDTPQQQELTSPVHVQQLLAQQRYQEAIDLLLLIDPRSINTWRLLAEAYAAQNNYVKATEAEIAVIALESDVLRREELLAQVRHSLLNAARTPALFGDDDIWLMSQLESLLNHSDNDGAVHLLLASLYLKHEDSYAAQYHALMAANDSAVQAQAEKILMQLNGDNIPDQLILPLVRLGNQFLVEVSIERYPARLLLDTGAALSGVTTAYATRHPDIIKAQRPIHLHTAAGVTESVLFTVDHFSLGAMQFDQHILALLPMHDSAGFDGLLGIDILGRFDFVIDQTSLTLLLKPRNP